MMGLAELKDEQLEKVKHKIKELKKDRIINRQDFKKIFGVKIWKNHPIKSNCLKFVVGKILPNYK